MEMKEADPTLAWPGMRDLTPGTRNGIGPRQARQKIQAGFRLLYDQFALMVVASWRETTGLAPVSADKQTRATMGRPGLIDPKGLNEDQFSTVTSLPSCRAEASVASMTRCVCNAICPHDSSGLPERARFEKLRNRFVS